MGIGSSFDPYGSQDNMVDRELGSLAYRTVRKAADNIDLMVKISKWLDSGGGFIYNGPPGPKGDPGKDGQNGKDGRSIQFTSINSSGHLIATMTDGTVLDAGIVVGRDGVDGKNGIDGKDGINGVNGTNGKEGRGVQTTAVNALGNLVTIMTDGTQIDAGNVVGPAGKDGKDGVDGKDAEQGITPDDAYMQARDVMRANAAFGMVQQQMLAESPVLRPPAQFIRAMMSGAVTIVVCGDSISAGSDYFYSNGWVQVFADMLREQIPWIKWTVINRSIGGRNLYHVSDPNYTSPTNFSFNEVLGGDTTQLWPLGTPTNGKAWRDYIRDDAPDMLIIAHQENHNDLNLEAAFGALEAYTNTWPKKPWFTVVSGFLPIDETNPDYGDAFKNANSQRQSLADWWRSFAMRKGYGLIDVNGVMRMLRDGIRRNVVPLMIERNWRYWGDAARWSVIGSAPTLSGQTIVFPKESFARREGVDARDVDFNADFVRGSPDSVARVLSYRMTGPDNLSGYSVQYDWDKNLVQLYRNTTPIANLSAAAAGPVTDTVNIRVRAFGNSHRVWVRGKLVIDIEDDGIMFAGSTLTGSGIGMVSIVRPQFGWAVEQKVAPQYYTNRDLFGSYPASYLTDPDSLGGDLIHHMSRLGVYLVYLPAVQVWLRQFKALFERPALLATNKMIATLEFAGPAGTTTVVSDMEIQFTVPQDSFGHVGITFGYSNPNEAPGQIQLFFDNLQIDEWYLNKTTSAIFSVNAGYLLGAGTHKLSLRILNGGEAPITSGGGGLSRHLTLSVMPS